MRWTECIRLRVKDVDFGRGELVVRNGKGGKDRRVPLPLHLREPLQAAIERTRLQHAVDLAEGFGEVRLPHALARKFPNKPRETGWQYVFFSPQRSLEPRSGKLRRHHVDDSVLQRAVRAAKIGRAHV